MIVALPGIFIGFMFILTIKLRKSPFDLSTSHHGHQEICQGHLPPSSPDPRWALSKLPTGTRTSCCSASSTCSSPHCATDGRRAFDDCAIYLLEIFIDNAYARLTWRFTVKASWIVAAILGGVNLVAAAYLFYIEVNETEFRHKVSLGTALRWVEL